MKKRILLGFACAAMALAPQSKSAEIENKIESLSLFKNGLAIINSSVRIPASGKYVLDEIPEPVHGTLWIDSSVPMTARITKVENAKESDSLYDNIQKAFAGKNVTVHLKGKTPATLSGVVMAPEKEGKKRKWNRDYEQSSHRPYYHYQNRQNIPVFKDRYIFLKTQKGVTCFDSNQIDFIEGGEINLKVKPEKNALVLNAKDLKQPEEIKISYISKGISWAPSYRINIENADSLEISQKAVIKNELSDFQNADVKLISGFPSIQFAHVTSPLSPQTTWSNFFRQLNMRPAAQHSVMLNVAVQQSASPNARAGIASTLPADFADSADIHYQNIGRFSMKEGDALILNVDKKTAKYEKIVEWIVPDTRDARGRLVQDYERRNNPQKYEDATWDSLLFKNPFSFPMTTAPATIYKNGDFLGETLSSWVNPGQDTVLHITKALSVSTKASEHEIKGKRERIYISGNDYQKADVEGKLAMKNYRSKPVKIMIKRRFSGELISANGKPKCELCEEGVYSVNERNELIWEITLKPGEEKILNYKYSLLVDL